MKGKSLKKQLLALVMAVVLCVGLLPVSAMAATDETASQDLTEEGGIQTLTGTTEYPDAGIPETGDLEWGITRSKEATNLEYNEETEQLESTVTLHVEHDIDLVIVQDGTNLENETFSFLESLEQQTNIHVNAGLVIFGGTVPISWSSGELLDLSDPNSMEILDNALNYDGWDDVAGHSGSNLQAGLREARRILDKDGTHEESDKFIVFISDCAARMWLNDDDEVMAKSYMIGNSQWFFDGTEDWIQRYGQRISESHNVLGDSSPYLFDYPSFTDVWNAGQNGAPIDDYTMTYEAWQEAKEDGSLAGSVRITNAGDDPHSNTMKEYYASYEAATYHTAEEFVKAASEEHIELISYSYYGYPLLAYTFGEYIDNFQQWLGELNNVTRHPYDALGIYGDRSAKVFDDIMEDIETTEVGGGVIIDEIGETDDYNFDFIDDISRLHLTAGGEVYDCTEIEPTEGATSAYGFGDPNGSDNGETYPFVLRYYEDGYTYTDEYSGEEEKYGECFVLELNTGISKYYYFNEETGELESGVSLTYDVTLTNPQTAAGTYGEYDQYGQNYDGSDDYGLYTNNRAVLYPKDKDGNPEESQEFPKPTVSYRSIEVEKEWEDEDDKDGIRPDSVTVGLIEDGEPTGKTITLSEDNEWKGGFAGLEIGSEGTEVDSVTVTDADDWNAIFNGLDKYDEDGNEIVYTFTEDPVGGYNTTVNGSTVTNTKTVNVSGSVIWNDDDDAAGVRPDSVTLHLCADGVLTGRKTVTAEDDWEWSFDGLDKYDEDGAEIEYTITEDTVKGYTSEVDGYTVTNTYEPEQTTAVSTLSANEVMPLTITSEDISGSINWYDGDDAEGNRPEEVTVTLYKDGVLAYYPDSDEKPATVTISAADDWEFDFGGDWEPLDEGHYTLVVSAADGYSITVTSSVFSLNLGILGGYQSCTFTVTYIASTDVSGSATWLDNDNENAIRPDSLTVHLLAFGVPAEDENGDPIVVEVTADDEWSWNFEGLDKYTEDGIKIAYTIAVDEVEGYNTKVHGYNVSNVEQTSASVEKFWNDGNDADGTRPDEVTIHIYAGRNVHEYSVQELDELEDYTATVYGDAETGFVISNVHVPEEKINIEGTKIWDDNDDQDGMRPDEIKIHLWADGKPVLDEEGNELIETVTSDEDGNWSWSFTDLPKYDDGREITYFVFEEQPENYTPKYEYSVDEDGNQTVTITNVHTPEQIAVTVNKYWDDEDNQDGKRPESITVELFANGVPVPVTDEDGEPVYEDGEPVYRTVTLDETNNWQATFDELAMYENGELISYTIEEVDAPEDYNSTIYPADPGAGEDIHYVYAIVNEYNPETTDIEVHKIWENDEDYNHRPDSIEVELIANDAETGKTITLSEDNGWSDTFTDLDVEENGEEIVYTVKEISDEALQYYTPKITYDDDGNATIVNYREFFDIDEEIVTDEDDRDSWVKNESVNEYNAIEIEMSTFLPVIETDELANGAFTMNFHEELDSELILDEADADFAVAIAGYRIDHKYYTVEIDPDDGCSFHVDVDLTALYLDGVITEEDLQGDTEIMVFFYADLEGTDLNGTYKSTVWYEVYDGEELEYTSSKDVVYVYTYDVCIEKYDSETEEALADATLGIYYDPECTEPVSRNGEAYTVVSGEDGTAMFYGLAEGTYYVTELEAPSGYVLSEEVLAVVLGEDLNDSGYTYTARYANTPEASEEETVDINGTKIWDDADDQDGIRPTEITINLMADGAVADTVTVTEADGWAWSFTDLPKYKDGQEIQYNITEDSVEEYSTDNTTSKDGETGDYTVTVTNSYTPEQTSVNVTKVWDDSDDQDGMRPESITVTLLADGEAIGQTLTLDAANNWQGSFTELDVNTPIGQPITYTIEEVGVEEYTSDITGDAATGYVITNTHTPETVEVSGSKTWDDADDQDGKRPESIRITLLADGVVADTLTVTDADGWAWSFADLAKYADGKEIAYTITEEEVEGYTTTYDGYNVINTHTPGTVRVPVIKVWDDEEDADGLRPDRVVIELLKNGEATGQLLTLDEDNDWTGSFSDLDEYTDGVKNVYTVQEQDVEGYTAEITDDAETGFVVTNTHTPDTGNPDTGNPDTGNPDTGNPGDGGNGGTGSTGGTTGSTSGSGSGSSGSSGSTTGAKTDDAGNAGLWMILIFIAAAVVAGSVTVRTRKQKTRS